jgi:hypothetical protein
VAAKGKGSRAGHGNGTVAGLGPSLRYDFAITNEAMMESSRWSRMRRAATGGGGLRRTKTVRRVVVDDAARGADNSQRRAHHRHASHAVRGTFDHDADDGDDDDNDDEFWRERIILLSGEKGPQFLQQSSAILATVLPGVVRKILPGWGHEILCNETEVGGTPAGLVPIVRELIPPEFFARHDETSDDDDESEESDEGVVGSMV